VFICGTKLIGHIARVVILEVHTRQLVSRNVEQGLLFKCWCARGITDCDKCGRKKLCMKRVFAHCFEVGDHKVFYSRVRRVLVQNARGPQRQNPTRRRWGKPRQIFGKLRKPRPYEYESDRGKFTGEKLLHTTSWRNTINSLIVCIVTLTVCCVTCDISLFESTYALRSEPHLLQAYATESILPRPFPLFLRLIKISHYLEKVSEEL